MRKWIMLAVVAMFVFGAGAALGASINGDYEGYAIVKVLVNGTEIKSDVPGINFKGRTMLPVRAIAEAVGLDVAWNQETFTATLTTKGQAAAPANNLSTSGFEFKNVSMKDNILKMAEIIGEVTNNSGKSYETAIFTMSLYGDGGTLIGTEIIAVSNVAAGATNSWKTYADAKSAEIKSYKFQFDSGY